MYNVGVKIYNSKLSHYRDLLEEWIACTNDYIGVWDGKDLPYWYNERANVSVLAGAAWRSGYTALEEFQAKKKASEVDEKTGRNDLYITNRQHAAYIEAKVVFPDIQKYASATAERLNLAVNDAHIIIDSAEDTIKIGAVFVAPHNKVHPASHEKIDSFINSISLIDCDAVAWCSHPLAQSQISHDERYYPVIAVVLKLASSSRF